MAHNLHRGRPRIYEGVRCGMPRPSIAGFRPYSAITTRPIKDLSMLLKLNSSSLITRFSFELYSDLLREGLDDDPDYYSLGLQP